MSTDAITGMQPVYTSNPISGINNLPQQQNIEVFPNENYSQMTDEMSYAQAPMAMSEQEYQNYYEELANQFTVDETKFNIFSTCFAA